MDFLCQQYHMHRIGLCLFKVHNVHFEVKMFIALWYTCSMSYNRVCHHTIHDRQLEYIIIICTSHIAAFSLSGHPDSKEIDVAASISPLSM